MTSLVLRRARIIGDGRLIDVAIHGGRVSAVGRALEVAHDCAHIDLDGRWIMPGLWDAHAHFTQWSRQAGRVDLHGAQSAVEAAATLLARVDGPGLVVGRGFQDALWPDQLTADALAAGGAPVVAVSHDLHCVWLNEAAASVLGAPHAGVLREAEAFAAEVALDRVMGGGERLVAAAVAAATARGIVGVRDLEFDDNVARWGERAARGHDSLRIEACIYPEHLAAADSRGLRSGDPVPGTQGLVTMGALKIFTDGALNTRTALTHEPYAAAGSGEGERSVGHAAHTPRELRELLAAATQRGLTVAAHAIGDAGVTMALDAFEATGAAGTIEHAQLVTGADLPRFARLGVAASVQPQHALDDRDVTDAVWGDRADRAFAFRSLADAGVQLMLGSDAPVAPVDPWVTIAAAVTRTDDHREPWHPEQSLSRREALAASVGRRVYDGWVAPGMTADLIAVDYDPLTATGPALRAMPVALTLLEGRVTHSELG